MLAAAGSSGPREGAAGVLADPAGGTVGSGGEAGGDGARLGPEGGITLAADRLERPGDGLPHEVALVAGGRLDQGEAAGEVGVAAMQREAGEEGEAGAAAELVGERGPGLDHRRLRRGRGRRA